MVSRSLNDLHPRVSVLASSFIQDCAKAGIDILITATYRSSAEQDLLYAQGRTASGPRVTNAKGGDSMHQYRVAFDFVPLVHGKADWANTMTFLKCGEIAEGLGIQRHKIVGVVAAMMFRYSADTSKLIASLHQTDVVQAVINNSKLEGPEGFRDRKLFLESTRFAPSRATPTPRPVAIQVNQTNNNSVETNVSGLPEFEDDINQTSMMIRGEDE